MTIISKALGGASIVALALAASPAFAAGTDADTTITNTVTVDYKVGNNAQTQKSAQDQFKVDRMINLTVTESNSSYTAVSPGDGPAVAYTTFSVTNNTNATIDVLLSAAEQTGSAGPFEGLNDSFNVNSGTLRVYVESGATPGYQPAEDTATYIDQLAEDQSRTVYVVGTIPIDEGVNDPLDTDDLAVVVLTGTAADANTAGTAGTALVATASEANTAMGVENVFADDAGATDATNDGKHSARDGFKIATALLSVAKTSELLSDPVSRGDIPYSTPAGYVAKMIPGAWVRYCVAISNTGSQTATDVRIQDAIPANLTYLAGTLDHGVSSSGAPCTITTQTGTSASTATQIDVTFPSVAANSYYAVIFDASIN